MKDRIAQIMQKEGLSNVEFAEKIGISTSSLSHIFNGRNKPSLEVVMRIHKAYPHINLNWLLYGEGPMTEESQEEKPEAISGIDFMWDNTSEKPEIAANPSDASDFGQKTGVTTPFIPLKRLYVRKLSTLKSHIPKLQK